MAEKVTEIENPFLHQQNLEVLQMCVKLMILGYRIEKVEISMITEILNGYK